MEGIFLSRPGFLRGGVTWTSLKRDENVPSETERLTRIVMIAANTMEQNLIKKIGINTLERIWMSKHREFENFSLGNWSK